MLRGEAEDWAPGTVGGALVSECYLVPRSGLDAFADVVVGQQLEHGEQLLVRGTALLPPYSSARGLDVAWS